VQTTTSNLQLFNASTRFKFANFLELLKLKAENLQKDVWGKWEKKITMISFMANKAKGLS